MTTLQPEPSEAERDRSMSGERMTSLLGFLSSHPRHAIARVALWYSIAALPLAAGALLIAGILAQSPDAAMSFIGDHGRALILYGMSAIGFAGGLGLTAGIAARAARSRLLVADSGKPPIGFGIAILVLILLGMLPWLVPVVFDLSARTRTLLAVLGVLPLVLIVAVVSLAPADDPTGRPLRRKLRWWSLAFPMAAVAVIALTRVGGIADAIVGWPWVNHLIQAASVAKPSWEGQYVIEGDDAGIARSWLVTGVVTILMAPAVCLGVMLVAFLRDTVVGDSVERRARKRPSARERASKRSLLGEGITQSDRDARRVGLSLEGVASKVAPAGEVPSIVQSANTVPTELPPDWIAGLRSTVDPSSQWGDWVPKRFSPGETAPPYTGKDSLREFFAGINPSSDQAEAFIRIHDRFAASLAEGEGRALWDCPSADVLIEGDPGSGRTAVVAAAAVHSVVTRGAMVLVLVPTITKRRGLVRRIRRCAESSGVGWYLNIGDLTTQGIAPWTQPDPENDLPVQTGHGNDQSVGVPGNESVDQRNQRYARDRRREELERSRVAPGGTPDILVGTLTEFEQCFFSSSADHARLSAVLRRIGLVVVEDVEHFDVRHRIHLPAVLDKIRLLLGSDGLRTQTAVVAPRLMDVARSFLVERLLSGKERIEPCHLRPFRLPGEAAEPWQVTLRALKPGPRGVSVLIEQCAKACIQSGTDVIIYSPFMSQSERRELTASIESAGSASARVVADLDELDDRECSELGAVFHAGTGGAGASLAIRSRGGAECVVVFTVLPSSVTALDTSPKSELLVLTDGASRAIFAAHFRSVSRFMGRLKAVHRDLWCRLGLPPTGDLNIMDGVDAALPVSVRDDERSVLLDPPDSRVVRYGREGPWPWAAISADGSIGTGEFQQPAAAAVDIDGMLNSALAIEVSPAATSFTVVMRNTEADGLHGASERRIAEWVSGADGQSIAFDDLAYAARLELVRGDSNFVPLGISEREGAGRGKLRIDGQLWSELRSEAGQSSLLVMALLDLEIPPAFMPRKSLQSALPRHVRLIETELNPVSLAASRADHRATGRRIDPLEQRQFATFEMLGVANERAEVIRHPFAIRFEASTFFMLFGFSDKDLVDDQIPKTLFGQWGKGRPVTRVLEPELGLAATFALRRHAPGLERLCRCIGFRITEVPGRQRIGLMFVEPASTRRSAFRLVDWIVRDAGLLGGFLDSMSRVLDESRESGAGGLAALLARGQTAIGAGISDDSTVQLDADRAEAVAGEIRAIAGQLGNAARRASE